MAERLIENRGEDFYSGKGNELGKILLKLGKLEDILEKYGFDAEDLDYVLEDYSKTPGREFALIEERDMYKHD